MNYKKMFKEYSKEAAILKIYIKSLKQSASQQNNITDVDKFKYRITLLYEMYLELKHIAEFLERRIV